MSVREVLERELGHTVGGDEPLESLGDSLELLSLVQALENETGTAASAEALGKMETVADLTAFFEAEP